MEPLHIDEKNEILSQLDFGELYGSEIENFLGMAVLGEGDCPFCDDGNRSLQINLDDGCFMCLSCAVAGSVFDFLMRKYNTDLETVLKFLTETIDKNSDLTEPEMNNGSEGKEFETQEAEVTSGFYFDREIYQSGAFLSLGKNSIKVLIALFDATPDNEGGELSIPHNLLEEVYKIPRSGISRAIGELQQKKFLKLVHHGGRGKGDRNFYSLSEDYKFWTSEKEEAQGENIESANEHPADLEGFAQDSKKTPLPKQAAGWKCTLRRAFGSIF